MPKLNPVCAMVNIPNTVQLCYLSGNLVLSDECCNDLQSARTRKVTCLCDNIIAHPSNASFTQALFDAVHTVCDVLDKFACTGI
ncbi:unnamed protein product [Arabis nemorensis]|uniref:Bifunctional inhibitor/plant lipid transfer protein/seed storage helical domain-containing protein n=1 Tax=Arabis nemorensis TaxID=586526 RepID=A0A565CEG0_9BRAS|nr:unnamed protein product [Arabis nemorensis]